MCTGCPSKRTSPLSTGWMPAMHLMSVDLPAPLSPTRAMTSPGATWKSTSKRACTAPKLFETPCSSRTGVSVTLKAPLARKRKPGAPTVGAPGNSLLQADLLALRGQVAGADLLHLGEVGLAGVLRDVVLRDCHGVEQHRGD